MSERYPGYDVLRKRDTPSWNAPTRAVIDERLAIDPARHRFFSDAEWPLARALCDRIVPQPRDRAAPVPLAAMLDARLDAPGGDGYRDARLPPMREAWRRGVAAIEGEARALYLLPFHEIAPPAQDALLTRVQRGEARDPAWGGMPPDLFFTNRVLHDIVGLYYGHPTSWNEIGFGGPAGPRGYVRMNFDRRDPWEASEARPGRAARARQENERVGRI